MRDSGIEGRQDGAPLRIGRRQLLVGAGATAAAAVVGSVGAVGLASQASATELRRAKPAPSPIPGGVADGLHIFLPGPEGAVTPFFELPGMGLDVDLNKGFTEFNNFLKGASDNSWQQEAEIIILNVARVMYLNGLPIAPGISLIPFDCRVEGNNDGCNARAACPEGTTIVAAVAACNLEYGTVSDRDLERVSRDTIRVVRASDNVSAGECRVGENSLRSGAVAMRGVNGSSAVSVGCKEHDNNGGDCHIRGTLQCQGQGRARPVVGMELKLPEGMGR